MGRMSRKRARIGCDGWKEQLVHNAYCWRAMVSLGGAGRRVDGRAGGRAYGRTGGL